MAEPPLLIRTIVSGSSRRAGGEQPAEVVGEGDVAEQRDHRAGGDGRDAERARERAVDAVRAAVREHARRVVAHRPEPLEVAHRHRGGDEHGRLGGQGGAERARHVRLAQLLAERLLDRARRAGVGLAPGPRARRARRAPAPRARAGPRAARARRPSSGPATAARGGRPGSGGRRVRPASHARSGFDVGRSPTRITTSGCVLAREALVAQERVVVGDRRLAAPARPRAGRRAGGSRRPARAPGSAGARPASSRPATITPRAPAGMCAASSTGASAARSTRSQGRPSARPPGGDAEPAGATSGSRSGQLRWTGPGCSPPAVA